jgi:glycosyltransferase involved in cell wall biosynthesis
MTVVQTIVVYSAVPWDHPVMWLRLRGPAEAAGLTLVQGNSGDQIDAKLVDSADLVIIQKDFPRFWSAYQEIADRARGASKPIVYEIDDLIFDMPEDHSHYEDYVGYLPGMLLAAMEADIVTVSSGELKRYIQELNPAVKVLPNFLDDHIWRVKPRVTPQDEKDVVLIGYMGGQTHRADLEEITPVLERIMARYGEKIGLRFWGVRPPEVLVKNPATEWEATDELDYRSFAAYFVDQECDIFIAPLLDNRFNRAKSSIKYLEYSALGIPGVYSRLPPYETVVIQGITGYLAGDNEEWENSLCRLIESSSLRVQVGQAAHQNTMQNWLLKDHALEWREAYDWVLNSRGRSNGGKENPLAKILRQSARRFEGIERELIQEKNRTNALEHQLGGILNSRSWQFLQRVQHLRRRLS